MASPYDGLVSNEKQGEEKMVQRTLGKGLLKSKTMWVNLLTMLAGAVTYFADSELVTNNPDTVAMLGVGLGLVNIILRFLTKEPITSVK